MPRYAPELECSVEDKASLVALAKSRTAEAHAVERARIILACLEGKEIQQGARERGVSLAPVSKCPQPFARGGVGGWGDGRGEGSGGGEGHVEGSGDAEPVCRPRSRHRPGQDKVYGV